MKFELHSAEEVAETLGVELDTLYRYARTGRIHGMKVGKAWRFLDVDVEEFLQKHRYSTHSMDRTLTAVGDRGHENHHVLEVAYAEVETASDALAADLLKRGFTPKERALILLSKSLEFMVGCLAVWKAGGVLVSESPTVKGEALNFIMHDCSPQALIVDGEVVERLWTVRYGLEQVRAVCVKSDDPGPSGLAPFHIHSLDSILGQKGSKSHSPVESATERAGSMAMASGLAGLTPGRD